MIHCMIIYGYDANTGMYKVQNSWGADWGYEGKCRIPMAWINEQGRDFYALRPPE
jgi:aminopeptidase C